MSGPWERYAQAEAGPWSKYATPEEPPTSAPRLVGQVAQNTNDAIAATVGAPVDLVASGLRQLGVPVNNPIGGSESIKSGIDYVATLPGRVSDAVSQRSLSPFTEDRTSRFEPLNRAEKIAAGTGQGIGSVLATMLPAGAVANAARPGTMTQGIAQALATQPLTQIASGAVGGATTGATDSPALGLAAALAVPMAAAGTAAAWRKSAGLISPDTEETTRRVLARALERDKTSGIALAEKQADLGQGALAVEAGGPNVRGVLRGSIAAPGASRTQAQNAFDTRIEGSNTRTTTALDGAISPTNSLAMTVDDLAAARAAAARPAYEAAGIPREVRRVPADRFDVAPDYVPNAPPKRDATGMTITSDTPYLITEPVPGFNSPTFETPQIRFLIENSPDVRAAIGAARKLPQFKDLPDNSMVMLDKAYKHLSGMEQEAIRAGNNTRAFDLKNLRTQFQDALTEANPKYQEALDAFSGPSKLIEAGQKGKEWFTKNTDPQMAAKEFQAMTPGEKEAALVGVRDWARTLIGRSDRGVAAERVWNGGDNRERLRLILGDEGFATLKKAMETERNAIKTSRDINVGSRTIPMGKEAEDTAQESVGPLVDLLKGNLASAASKFAGRAYDRVVEGRTEAVNKRLAELLVEADPRATAAYFRKSMMPTYQPGAGAVVASEVGRQAINEDGARRSLARALMQANERRAGAAR